MRRSDVQELTISDHYLVYASLDLKVPKQSKISITTRTFKNYVAEEFAEDISRVPWDSLELLNSIDEKVELSIKICLELSIKICLELSK